MKKVFVILVAIIAVTTSTFAQNGKRKKVTQIVQENRMRVVDKPIGKITESGDTLRMVGVREIETVDGLTRNVTLMMSAIAPVVEVYTKRDGSIRKVKILHSSGNPAIDIEGIREIESRHIPPRRVSDGKTMRVRFINSVSYLLFEPETI